MATATQIAKEIGIDKSTLSKWRKRPGCPPLSAGGKVIKAWHDETFMDRGPKLLIDDEDDINMSDIDFTLPEGSNAKDVLFRMEKSERRLFGLIEAWEGQRRLTPKQSSKLAQLRREYRDTSKLVIAAKRAVLEMEQQEKSLVQWETADAYVLGVLEEIIKFPRNLTGRGNDQPQRDLLQQVAKDLQIAISEASKLAAQKVRPTE